MIEAVKENPCTDCGIKGLYENCNGECVQYRKWYQYQQGRADAIEDSIRVFTEIAEMCGMGYTFIRRVGMKMEQLKELK